jgi:hypothetical protein
MTCISRCLPEFRKDLDPLDVAEIKRRLAALPAECPHGDCSEGSCEQHCRAWVEMQYRIAKRKRKA